MQFSALFSYMLWQIELKFCIWLSITVLQIKFECRHFAFMFVGVMPLLELRILKIHSFLHFSLSGFDILSSNFAYDFVLPYYRSNSSVVNLRQFLWELCPFWNLEYWKDTVFRTFLLHALTYWAEILHMTLFYCTIDQIWVSSIFVGVMPLLELRILKIHNFLHFSLTCFDIELKFCIWLCLTILQIKFNCRQFASIFVGVMPLLERTMMKYTVFRTFLLHALTYWAEILHMTLFYCTSDQV